jgi:hypothetical protein
VTIYNEEWEGRDRGRALSRWIQVEPAGFSARLKRDRLTFLRNFFDERFRNPHSPATFELTESFPLSSSSGFSGLRLTS